MTKSVRSLSIYRPAIERLGTFRLAHALPTDPAQLRRIGFRDLPEVGDSIIPEPVGKASDFNANGKEIVRRDLPKEPEARMVYRTWNDWHGYSHSGTQFRTYMVYPREQIQAPGEYVTVMASNGAHVIASRALSLAVDDETCIIHLINLYLELFGEVQIADADLKAAEGSSVRRLNWQVLPPGVYPFERARDALAEQLSDLPDTSRDTVEYRIKHISAMKPDFLAVGLGGFRGYMVFGFTAKKRYILESPQLGNATYVFSSEWESLSQKTKKEILDGSLHEARVIHNGRWTTAIRAAIG